MLHSICKNLFSTKVSCTPSPQPAHAQTDNDQSQISSPPAPEEAIHLTPVLSEHPRINHNDFSAIIGTSSSSIPPTFGQQLGTVGNRLF
jgi:hypothetical protein